MPKRQSGYEELLSNVVDTLKQSPEEINNVIATSEEVVQAANDMTKDEIALVSAYVKSDLQEFASSFEKSKSGPFYTMISNTIWQSLLDITDRSKVEWVEFFQDLEHQGVYKAGEIIGLGSLVCEKCGHKTLYNHATEIVPCSACGHDEFTRQSLKP
ncbi:zinc ribbon-containing protein [Vibrio gallicus]|uniref:zinc ribbon-containing protein n=1 Tax=Vibrio gallicus TaxID=190897 RepID=UPI0021C4C002|nr:zinc ribbon-containing protein [Vibrio gallicus]